MSVTIKIKRKKVQLTAETMPIVEAYKEALEENKLSVATDEPSYASPNESQARTGFWARHVSATLENITANPHGAKELPLTAFEVELEAPAEILLRGYLIFLNKMLLKHSLDAKDTELAEITSKYVLIRELLYRLVVIALSNKLDYLHDGDKLITALKGFIKKIKESEHLVERPTFFANEQNTLFLLELSLHHPKWTSQIEQMVAVVKMIHSNSKTISNTLNWLKSAEITIQRQIVAFIDDQTNPAMLADGWIDTTLEKCENKLIENAPKTKIDINALIIAGKLEINERQVKILSYLPTSSVVEIKRKKIGSLYNLLNQTYFLHQIMANMDLLITYTGWMPILAGVIAFDKLAAIMKSYNRQCGLALEIPQELQFVLDKPVGRGLVKYSAITGHELGYTVLQNVEELNNLQNGALKQRIGDLIVSALSSLVQLQSKLPSAHHFINIDKTTQIYISADFKLLSAGALAQRQQLVESEKLLAVLKIQNAGLQEEIERLKQENRNISLISTTNLVITQLLHTNLINNCQSIEILEMLKNQGANLKVFCNQQNPYEGYTALHIAASTNNLFACQWLLDQGIDVNIETDRGETALDKASKRALREIIDHLKGRGGRSMLIQGLTQQLHEIIDDENITEDSNSVTQAHLERLNDLVNHGADVDGINESRNAWNGDRPLHTLLVKRNQRLIAWAMTVGANSNLLHARRPETPYEFFCKVADTVHQEPMKTFLDTEFRGKFLPTVVLEQNPVIKEPYCPYFVNKHKNELIRLGVMAMGATAAVTYKYYYEQPHF